MFTREEQIEHEKAWKLNDDRIKEQTKKAEAERAERIKKGLEWLDRMYIGK